LAISISFTVEDAKGAQSTVQFNVGDGLTQASMEEIALELAPVIKTLMKGGIKKASACVNLDISSIAGIDTIDPDSDVEEGGRFIWNVAGGYAASNRLATFDEAYVLPNTRVIDTTDTDVAAFLTLLTTGVTTTDNGLVTFTDYRGADIASLDSARESFQRSRRVR